MAKEVQWTEENLNELRALSLRVEERLEELSLRLRRVEDHVGLTDRTQPTQQRRGGR